MTYLKPLETNTTSVQHRFASDLYGQGVDVCSGCGGGREDRDHVSTAPAYVDALESRLEAPAKLATAVPTIRTTADQLEVGTTFKFGHKLRENRDAWTVVSFGERHASGAWDMTVTSDQGDVRYPVVLPSVYPEDRVLIIG